MKLFWLALVRPAVVATLAAAFLAGPARAADEVIFGTNWVAQAEHGGFYQALVDGTYEKYGLKVTIKPGGPHANNRILLPVGKIDFHLGGNMLQAFSAVDQNIPTMVVAAIFQKEPQCILTHPGQGLDTWDSLKSINLLIGKGGFASFFQWMKSEHGFKEEKVKPYTFSAAPFLADKRIGQQGYVTSEPFVIEKQGGFKPNVFLLADHGFDTYATTIETRNELVEKKPDLVKRFVEASIVGWYNYLYRDNKAANELIKKDNPEMTDAAIQFAIAKMKEHGIVDSGDSLKSGIGAMTEARMKSFFDKMVKSGVVKPAVDYKKAYTLQFVNKSVGVELRPKN